EDMIDDLHFEEVVARAERAALLGAARLGVIADGVRVRAVEMSVRLRVLDVAALAVSLADDVARPLREQPRHLAAAELVTARLAGGGGNVLEEAIDQLAQMVLHFAVEEIRPDQTYAAVDIVAHPPRRYHTSVIRIRRAHAADAEAVAPMNIRHGQTG